MQASGLNPYKIPYSELHLRSHKNIREQTISPLKQVYC